MGSNINIGKGFLSIVSESKETINQSFNFIPAHKKDSEELPKNQLGIAIIDCMDRCDLGLVELSNLLKKTTKTPVSTEKGVIRKQIKIPPTTLHSYTLPGTTRTIRKYSLDEVLLAIKIIMNNYDKGHSKWVDKENVKKDITYWLSIPEMTPKRLKSITGLTEQIIGRYAKGLYDVNYEKWDLIRTAMKKYEMSTKK